MDRQHSAGDTLMIRPQQHNKTALTHFINVRHINQVGPVALYTVHTLTVQVLLRMGLAGWLSTMQQVIYR